MSALDIGVSQEELLKLVVDRAAEKLLNDLDDLGEISLGIDARLQKAIEAHIGPVIEKAGIETIGPRVEAMIEGLTFQQTSSYGEPKAPAKTWRELLVERAEKWLTEPVNSSGKARGDSDSYSWSKSTTRIAYMVDQHLQFHIEQTMKAALLDANKKIGSGILEAVRLGLNSALAKLDVKVKVGN